jgi:hypothetical protein
LAEVETVLIAKRVARGDGGDDGWWVLMLSHSLLLAIRPWILAGLSVGRVGNEDDEVAQVEPVVLRSKKYVYPGEGDTRGYSALVFLVDAVVVEAKGDDRRGFQSVLEEGEDIRRVEEVKVDSFVPCILCISYL